MECSDAVLLRDGNSVMALAASQPGMLSTREHSSSTPACLLWLRIAARSALMPPCSALSSLRANNHRMRHAVAATEALIQTRHATLITPADTKALYGLSILFIKLKVV